MTRSLPLALALIACRTGDPGEPGANQPPWAPVIEVTPTAPTTADDIAVVVLSASSDPDGDDVTYTYRWFVDGALAGDLHGDTVPADRTRKGERWRVVVVPNDGAADGPPADATATVVNAPPTATVSIAPAAPLTAHDLVATAASSDADGDPVDLAWSWTVDGADAGIDTDTVPASRTARGQTWAATAVPSDDERAGAAASATVAIGNTPPRAISVRLETLEHPSDTVFTNDHVVVVVETEDADGDSVIVSVEWTVNGAPAGGTGPLPGPTAFAKGDEIVATIVPDDGTDLGTALTSDPVVVADSPPSAPEIAIRPGDPTVDDDLVCEIVAEGADPDGDPITYDVGWDVGGSPYTGAATTTLHGDTVPADATSGGQTWTCDVTATADGAASPAAQAQAHLWACHPSDPVDVVGWTRTYDVVYEGQAGTELQTALGDGDYQSVLLAGDRGWDVVQMQSCDGAGRALQEGWEGTVRTSEPFGMALGFAVELDVTSIPDTPRPYLADGATLESGGAWTYSYRLAMSGTETSTGQAINASVPVSGQYTAWGTQSITVPAGTFEAAYIVHEYTQDWSALDPTNTLGAVRGYSELWYVSGVGLVKEHTTDLDDTTKVFAHKELTAFTGLVPAE